jgi:ERCC4-type nuclease
MLFVDSRVGSQDLAPVLRSLGLSVDLTTLDFGDVAFIGNGPDDTPVPVGLELKKLNDILQCITTGRFAGHQLPGLIQTYDQVWLIIEGLWRANPKDGVLETRAGGEWRAVNLGSRTWMYRDFESFLTTMEMKGGIRIRRTNDRHETARTVAGLYSWWCNKEFEEHRSHLALSRAHQMRDSALLVPPSLRYRVAAELPGLGTMKAGMVAGHFESVRAMVNADEKEWQSLPGIGKTLAKRIVTEIASSSH